MHKTMHKLARIIAAVFAFAMCAPSLAATETTWTGGSGGTEAEPLDIYNANNLASGKLPSDSYGISFSVNSLTHLTNSFANATTTRIADGISFNSGDFVIHGPLRFYTLYTSLANGTASIVKKGDWWIDWYFRGGAASGHKTAFTNESGSVTVGQRQESFFANGKNSKFDVVSKSGNWAFNNGYTVWIAGGEGSSVTIDKIAGNWSFANVLIVCGGVSSTASIYNRGGSFSVEKTMFLGKANNARANLYVSGGSVTAKEYGIIIGKDGGGKGHSYLYVSGGAVTNLAGNFVINESTAGGTAAVRVTGGEVCAQTGFIHVGASGAATLTIDGGLVSAPASGVVFCGNSGCIAGRDSFLNLNGGTLAAKTVTYGAGAANGTFTFNGGTLEALAAGTLVASHNRLFVKVASNGGTVDANAKAVTIGEPILEDSSSTGGGMTFKGGGTVTLAGGNTYTGATTVELGTTLSVASPSDIPGVLGVAPPAGLAAGRYVVLTTTGSSAFDASILDGAVVPEDCELAVVDDGRIVACVYKRAQMAAGIWLGTKNNDLCDGENWSNGVVPNGTAATISCTVPATLVCSGSFTPSGITFPAGSALVTISGPGAISGISSIVNNTSLHHVFNCQVTCPDGVTPNITRTEAAYMTFAGGLSMHNAPKTGGGVSDFWSGNVTLRTTDKLRFDSENQNYLWIVNGGTFSVKTACVDRAVIDSGAKIVADCLEYTGCARYATANNKTGWFSAVFDNFNGVIRVGEIRAQGDALLFHSYAGSDMTGGTIIADKLTCAQDKQTGGAFPYPVFMLNCGAVSGADLDGTGWNGEGVWAIGPGGLSFAESVHSLTQYELKLGKSIGGRPAATLHSFADWTLHANPNGRCALAIQSTNSTFLVIDTSHYTIGEPEYDSATSHDVTLTGTIDGGGAMRVVGNGRVIFNSASSFTGGLTVSNAATVAVNAGCKPGNGSVLVTGGATLSLPQTGTVTIPGAVTLQDDAVLSFNFTNGAGAPKFVFTAGATVPDGAAAKVKVSAAAGVQPRRLDGKWLIAEGVSGTFALDEETKPTWANGVSVEGVNLYLNVKAPGLTLSVR